MVFWGIENTCAQCPYSGLLLFRIQKHDRKYKRAVCVMWASSNSHSKTQYKTHILCDNCNAPHSYGLVFSQNCSVPLKDTLVTGTAQQTLVISSTRIVRQDIVITFRAGGDASHNFRGGRSCNAEMGRNARKHHKLAIKFP